MGCECHFEGTNAPKRSCWFELYCRLVDHGGSDDSIEYMYTHKWDSYLSILAESLFIIIYIQRHIEYIRIQLLSQSVLWWIFVFVGLIWWYKDNIWLDLPMIFLDLYHFLYLRSISLSKHHQFEAVVSVAVQEYKGLVFYLGQEVEQLLQAIPLSGVLVHGGKCIRCRIKRGSYLLQNGSRQVLITDMWINSRSG